MTDYATLEELKKARGITAAGDDDALQATLTAASRAIDKRTGRRFDIDADPSARTYNPRGRVVGTDDGYLLLVDDIGTTAGLIVETGTAGGTSWTTVTGYETSPDNALAKDEAITGILRVSSGWGSGPTRIRITARWGWPAIPDEINRATLILANRLYLRKDTPEGVKGTAEWGAIRMSRVDPDVENLIGPYVLPGIA